MAGRNTAAESSDCNFKRGCLEPCAPLAAAYVPIQQENPPTYGSNEALARGTLFPGLDLPFMNVVNKSTPYTGTPLGELMALSFVIKELNLYLDTHTEDEEAFELLQKIIKLNREGRAKYAKMYGPLSLSDLENSSSYNWLKEPWPWEYSERMGQE